MENIEIDYSVVGKRIKEARLKKGYTQNTLAEELDLSVAYLSRLEKGRSKVNLKRLNQICTILDISLGEVLTGTSVKSEQYLNKELYEVLVTCTPEKQKLIYEIARLVSELDFV